MDSDELAVKYPLGTLITFRRTDRGSQETGIVNGPPMQVGDMDYVPVYVSRRSTMYVNTVNIVEES